VLGLAALTARARTNETRLLTAWFCCVRLRALRLTFPRVPLDLFGPEDPRAGFGSGGAQVPLALEPSDVFGGAIEVAGNLKRLPPAPFVCRSHAAKLNSTRAECVIVHMREINAWSVATRERLGEPRRQRRKLEPFHQAPESTTVEIDSFRAARLFVIE